MKCFKCGKIVVYYVCYMGRYYCKKYFNEMVEKKFKEIVKKYWFIEKGERIVVGVSGGKDSVVFMYFLVKFCEKFFFEFVVIIIDEGIVGYWFLSVEIVKRNVKKFGIEYCIYLFKEYIGFMLDEIVEIMGSFEKGECVGVCFYCGVWRCWLFNYVVMDVGVDKLVVGYNLDDEV